MRSMNRSICYLLITASAVLLIWDHHRTKGPPTEPTLSLDDFYSLTAKNQGGRKKQDSYCQHSLNQNNDECFEIMDEVVKVKDKWMAARFIVLPKMQGAYLTSVQLKPPKDRAASQTDTQKWEIHKAKLHFNNYAQLMLEGLFTSGVLPTRRDVTANVLQIGLGGGQMNNVLSTVFPNLKLTVVDISSTMRSMAEKWFGLRESDNLRVVITDGLQFVKEAAAKGDRYDAILIDACYNNADAVTVCPVPPFYEPQMIADLGKLLGGNGVLIYNLLIMNYQAEQFANTTRSVVALHNKVFPYCSVERVVENSLNQVLMCSQHSRPGNHAEALKEVNDLMKTAAEEEEQQQK